MVYDAAIVGAGPSGANAGLKLAQAGRRVLIIEKKVLPRYKTCGGGLTQKCADLLPEGWDSLVEDRISNFVFLYKCQRPVPVKFEAPLVFTVMRDRFDAWLAEKAKAAGANLLENTPVKRISDRDGELEIETSSGETYRARYVIGADGAGSIVRRLFAYDLPLCFARTIETEVETSPAALSRHHGLISLDYGLVDYGYNWIFPKSGHLSIGAGSFSRRKIDMVGSLDEFIKSAGPKQASIRKLSCHPIPYLTDSKAVFHCGRTLLAGDAAGLSDPFTGEGIYYALKSGDLAAKVINDSIETGNTLDDYTDLVQKEFMDEFEHARKISRVVFSLKGTIHQIVSRQPQLAKMMLEVAYGTRTYQDLVEYLKKLPVLRLASQFI